MHRVRREHNPSCAGGTIGAEPAAPREVTMTGMLDKSFGRQAFGDDPANYHAARPRYPQFVWDTLRERRLLREGTDIVEIGAGTGLATEHLLAATPRRLVAVVPDARLAAFLAERLPGVEVLGLLFEGAVLPGAGFDLAASATAFHWLDAI